MWVIYSMDYHKIGQKIRKIRKAHGLSQEELAERIGISTTHMSHIETGNTKLSLQVFVDIAAALEVRTDELLDTPAVKTTSTSLDDIAIPTARKFSCKMASRSCSGISGKQSSRFRRAIAARRFPTFNFEKSQPKPLPI